MVVIQLLKIIDGSQKQKQTKIITYFPTDDTEFREVEIQEKNELFWDVVGDTMVFSEIELLSRGQLEGGICFLIPGYEQPEGFYYSNNVLQRLFEISEREGAWKYFLFDSYNSMPNYKIPTYRTRIDRKDLKNDENDKSSIVSKLSTAGQKNRKHGGEIKTRIKPTR